MKVKEAIELLQKQDPEALILFTNADYGWNETREISAVKVRPKLKGITYCGDYIAPGKSSHPDELLNAVVLEW